MSSKTLARLLLLAFAALLAIGWQFGGAAMLYALLAIFFGVPLLLGFALLVLIALGVPLDDESNGGAK